MADFLTPLKSSYRESHQKVELDLNDASSISLLKDETNRTLGRMNHTEPIYQQLEFLSTKLDVAK